MFILQIFSDVSLLEHIKLNICCTYIHCNVVPTTKFVTIATSHSLYMHNSQVFRCRYYDNSWSWQEGHYPYVLCLLMQQPPRKCSMLHSHVSRPNQVRSTMSGMQNVRLWTLSSRSVLLLSENYLFHISDPALITFFSLLRFNYQWCIAALSNASRLLYESCILNDEVM